MVNIYKLELTVLQQRILRFLLLNAGKNYNQRNIALHLNVSPVAVSKSIALLKHKRFIIINKDRMSKVLQIGVNFENSKILQMKRVENLKAVYSSGLLDYLRESLPGATIILFGSYAFGEDNEDSDIDIAVIGHSEKQLDLRQFENQFSKNIIVQYYSDFSKIHKNLQESLFNGIVLKGGIRL